MSGYGNLVLNRITCPKRGVEALIKGASDWGFTGVELRNDLPGGAITDRMPPDDLKELAEQSGIRIISINALQRFNDGDPASHLHELEALASLAADLGRAALVLCPVNDPGDHREKDLQFDHTVQALEVYAPVFERYGVAGLVEPLGFAISSLRTKRRAIKAIEASGKGVYKILHDTFHHFLSGERDLFPGMTGLVHISGVESYSPMESITDDDRILVGPADRMGNKAQIKGLMMGGYEGPISIEAFSPTIQALAEEDLLIEIQSCREYLSL